MTHENKTFTRPQVMLTTGYIASSIHVVQHTVRKYIRLGLLKASKPKGYWLVKREDFEAFKQERGSKG